MEDWKEKVPLLNEINHMIYVLKNLAILSHTNGSNIKQDIEVLNKEISLLETKYHII